MQEFRRQRAWALLPSTEILGSLFDLFTHNREALTPDGRVLFTDVSPHPILGTYTDFGDIAPPCGRIHVPASPTSPTKVGAEACIHPRHTIRPSAYQSAAYQSQCSPRPCLLRPHGLCHGDLQCVVRWLPSHRRSPSNLDQSIDAITLAASAHHLDPWNMEGVSTSRYNRSDHASKATASRRDSAH